MTDKDGEMQKLRLTRNPHVLSLTTPSTQLPISYHLEPHHETLYR